MVSACAPGGGGGKGEMLMRLSGGGGSSVAPSLRTPSFQKGTELDGGGAWRSIQRHVGCLRVGVCVGGIVFIGSFLFPPPPLPWRPLGNNVCLRKEQESSGTRKTHRICIANFSKTFRCDWVK